MHKIALSPYQTAILALSCSLFLAARARLRSTMETRTCSLFSLFRRRPEFMLPYKSRGCAGHRPRPSPGRRINLRFPKSLISPMMTFCDQKLNEILVGAALAIDVWHRAIAARAAPAERVWFRLCRVGETQINVILSKAKDQFACEDGCKSLKSLHAT